MMNPISTSQFGTVVIARTPNEPPTELEIKLRNRCQKIRIVPSLSGNAHVIFPRSDNTLALRIYNANRIANMEKEYSESTRRNISHQMMKMRNTNTNTNDKYGDDNDDNNKANNNEANEQIDFDDFDFDRICTFRDCFKHSIVFFVLPPSSSTSNELISNQLGKMDSIVNILQRCLTTSRKCNSSSGEKAKGNSRVYIVPDYDSILQTISITLDSCTKEKSKLKEHYFQQEAKRVSLPQNPTTSITDEIIQPTPNDETLTMATQHVRNVFQSWAEKRMDLSIDDTNVIMNVLGSLEKIMNATEDVLEEVPINPSTKRGILKFFGDKNGNGGSELSSSASPFVEQMMDRRNNGTAMDVHEKSMNMDAEVLPDNGEYNRVTMNQLQNPNYIPHHQQDYQQQQQQMMEYTHNTNNTNNNINTINNNNTTTTNNNNNNNSNMKSPIKKNTKITLETYRAAQKLFISITELNDLLPNLALKSMNYSNKNDPSESNHDDDDSCDGGGGSSTGARASTRKSMLSQGNTIIAGIQSAIASIVSLFDAPPHESIFGLDVLRGTMLSRYVGAKQYWFPRPKSEGGGMIDVLHIPSYSRMLDSEGTLSNTDYNGQCKQKIEKAVLFCNPNAGLVEVATGISLIGGNVANNGRVSNMACWSDFYVENGFDIFLFNYAGFGRSYAGKNGGSSCVGPATKERSMNAFCVLGRIVYNSFFGFKPTPSSLKADAFAVANHMITQFDVGDMVIHGESIGGMAAASAGRKLSAIEHFNTATSVPKSYPTLLLCDRTFCNLDSVAERLVGSWTSAVIPLLTPFWNTDVAGDFIAATCKKVIAQDAADSIIHFAASLKKGVATAKELNKGSTKGVGKFLDRPLHYRMSDWENVGVLESKFVNVKISLRQIQAPIWPADKYFDLREAFHFAACARRIGKVATTIRKEMLWNSNNQLLSKFEDEEEGIEITAVFSRDTSPDEDTLSCQTDEKNNVILEVWETLARCDGLTGLPLGAAVKEGDDCVIDWLSCLTIFGSQRVAKEAEKRMDGKTDVVIQSVDFDVSVSQRDDDEEETRLVPLPLPGVITLLTQLYQDKEIIKDIEKELEYCIQMLEYILSRITAKTYVTRNLDITHFRETFEGVATGRYLNLNCGHNNQYSAEERLQLCAILTEACDSENFFA